MQLQQQLPKVGCKMPCLELILRDTRILQGMQHILRSQAPPQAPHSLPHNLPHSLPHSLAHSLQQATLQPIPQAIQPPFPLPGR